MNYISNYPKAVIFFYSKYSKDCIPILSLLDKNNIDFVNRICIDSKKIRSIISSDNQLGLSHVPSIFCFYHDGNIEKYVGNDSYLWVTKISENLQNLNKIDLDDVKENKEKEKDKEINNVEKEKVKVKLPKNKNKSSEKSITSISNLISIDESEEDEENELETIRESVESSESEDKEDREEKEDKDEIKNIRTENLERAELAHLDNIYKSFDEEDVNDRTKRDNKKRKSTMKISMDERKSNDNVLVVNTNKLMTENTSKRKTSSLLVNAQKMQKEREMEEVDRKSTNKRY